MGEDLQYPTPEPRSPDLDHSIFRDQRGLGNTQGWLKDMDSLVEDGNSGLDIYCQVVLCVISYFIKSNYDSDSN